MTQEEKLKEIAKMVAALIEQVDSMQYAIERLEQDRHNHDHYLDD